MKSKDQSLRNALFVITCPQKGSDPKEIYFNLYGLHCPPSAPFHWDKVAGKDILVYRPVWLGINLPNHTLAKLTESKPNVSTTLQLSSSVAMQRYNTAHTTHKSNRILSFGQCMV